MLYGTVWFSIFQDNVTKLSDGVSSWLLESPNIFHFTIYCDLINYPLAPQRTMNHAYFLSTMPLPSFWGWWWEMGPDIKPTHWKHPVTTGRFRHFIRKFAGIFYPPNSSTVFFGFNIPEPKLSPRWWVEVSVFFTPVRAERYEVPLEIKSGAPRFFGS